MTHPDDPLATAAIRLAPPPRDTGHVSATSELRPLGPRHLPETTVRAIPTCTYSHREQVTVDRHGRHLLEATGDDWVAE